MFKFDGRRLYVLQCPLSGGEAGLSRGLLFKVLLLEVFEAIPVTMVCPTGRPSRHHHELRGRHANFVDDGWLSLVFRDFGDFAPTFFEVGLS